ADLDSDGEEEIPQNQYCQQQATAPIEGLDDEEEPAQTVDEDAPMEIDDPAQTQSHDLDLLNYNVYLLDATAADMQAPTGVLSLIMRLCGDGVPSAVGGTNAAANSTTSSSTSTNGSAAVNGDPSGTGARGVSDDKANTEVGVGVSTWGVHTDGPDGHVVGMEETEAGMGTGVEAGIEYVDVDAEMEMGMEVDGEGEGAGDVEMDVDGDTEEDEDADEAARAWIDPRHGVWVWVWVGKVQGTEQQYERELELGFLHGGVLRGP
ncbi:hypothetical protein H0H92_011914, partial [Tricholoma furcatifolium]